MTSINHKKILDLEKAAMFLGISTATVRNWVKCGNLKTLDESRFNFYLREIENLKADLENGSLEKLNGRANKTQAGRTFLPDEYLKADLEANDLVKIIAFIEENKIDVSFSLLLLALNLLQKENLISNSNLQNLFEGSSDWAFKNKQINAEIKSWLSAIKITLRSEYSFLLNCPLPMQRDILGCVYQSLLLEGKKSQSGSYYTPEIIVQEMIQDYAKKDSKVLDPCCGTGQFLLAFADVIDNPNNIYGVDLDEIAVRIARLNLLIQYQDRDFVPQIFCKNTLLEIGNADLFSFNDASLGDFDVIATNPPWGVHFSKTELERLKKSYPEITSLESFSYFLKKSLDLLRDNGVISFLLPESILNVKTHQDIRGVILNNTRIKKVHHLNRVFKNVFTPVIRLDLTKDRRKNGQIQICKESGEYTAEQARWEKNQNFIFDIHASNFDTDMIAKAYGIPHTTLLGNAEWALGIVTGNNQKSLVSTPQKGFEAIYKGKNVDKFVLKQPSSYICWTPEKFQQVAPLEKYRAPEKLIYKFISRNLVFAYDDQQRLTLNSANLVIPKIPHYPLKVIAALFNSALYQFIFQKKFASLKVLRSQLEQMPLPLWDNKIFAEIIQLVNGIIAGKIDFNELDDYIFKKFSFSSEEIKYIQKIIK